MNQPFCRRGSFDRIECRADGCKYDRAALVDSDCELITHLNPSEIHEGRVKNDSVGIADFGDRLGHGVILCFTHSFAMAFLACGC